MKYLPLIFHNLMRNRRRTILTTLSIAMSMTIFAVVATLPAIANRLIKATASSTRIACHNKAGLFYGLPEAYRRPILSTANVRAASGFAFFAGVYRDPHEQVGAFGVDADQFDAVWPDWGLTPTLGDRFRRLRTALIVAPPMMRRFGWRIGQQVTLRGTSYPTSLTFEVIGELQDSGPPDALLFRRDYLEEALHQPGVVNAFWIAASEPASVPLILQNLKEMFTNSDAEVECEQESVFISNMTAGVKPLIGVLQSIGYIVVLIVGLVAGNTAAMAVRERSDELAVMRSLGFEAPTILFMLLAEGLLIAVTGGVLGATASQGVLRALPMLSASFGPLGYLHIPASVLAQCLMLSVLVGTGSGALPAISQLRKDVVASLRHLG